MVDTVNHTGLSLSQLDGVATNRRETYENQKPRLIAAKPMDSGLGVEKQISTPVEAELFS
jgi:hypothetical protein